ncbi:HD domain-containing protein [Victivallis sp. Marseille-Q1083]|mgnify:CR=1 FL=1|uniref:Ppx/GppA phosphatase family protein n=1 Tax=Victivallis sp. Marseille-Q1083 TaxID=2717288 RepID=UPI001588884D|nr:HD domain-containing protein [Victivallis sp. Marseille-Q1083]
MGNHTKKIAGLPLQAGIIDIGAHSVRLEIFQIRRDGAVEVLESLTRPVNLGYDSFRRGIISSKNINLLCAILQDFAERLREYDIRYCRTVATSAIREAFNRDLVIDRVLLSSGLHVEVLENQEETRLIYLAMKEELQQAGLFESLHSLAFAIGTGSLILMYFEQRQLKFSESITLGSVRWFDEYGRAALSPEKISELLESLDIRRRLEENAGLPPEALLTLIGMGAGVRTLVDLEPVGEKVNDLVRIKPGQMRQLLQRAVKWLPEELVERHQLPDYLAMSIAPSGCIIDYFLKELNCKDLLFSEITTRQALLAGLIREREAEKLPFLADLLSSAENVGRKYCFDAEHGRGTMEIALRFFDKLRHRYGMTERMRIALQIAALLHDVGRFIDSHQHHRHSYYLLSNIQLPGISERERNVIALVARYHHKSAPKASHPEFMALTAEEKVVTVKLAAILRLADALDRINREKFRLMKLSLSGDELRVRVAGVSIELGWEDFYLAKKGDLFQEVFGLTVRMEEELGK